MSRKMSAHFEVFIETPAFGNVGSCGRMIDKKYFLNILGST